MYLLIFRPEIKETIIKNIIFVHLNRVQLAQNTRKEKKPRMHYEK